MFDKPKNNKFILTVLCVILLFSVFTLFSEGITARADEYTGICYEPTNNGYVYNSAPQTVGENESVMIEFDILSFEAKAGFAWIGFCASDARNDYYWHDACKKYLFYLGNTNSKVLLIDYNSTGTEVLQGCAYNAELGETNPARRKFSGDEIEGNVTFDKIFKPWQTVRAVFSPSERTYEVFTKSITGKTFRKVQSVSGVDLPAVNAYYALHFCGACKLTVANYTIKCGEDVLSFSVSDTNDDRVTVTENVKVIKDSVSENYAGILNASGIGYEYSYLSKDTGSDNVIMEFDLLNIVNSDYIGFFAGASNAEQDKSADAQYFCRFNKDGTFEGGNGFEYGMLYYSFDDGKSYRVIFDVSGQKFVLQSKLLTESNLNFVTDFTFGLNAQVSDVTATCCGIQVSSAPLKNSSVIIDNLLIADGDLTDCYYNDFNNAEYGDIDYSAGYGGERFGKNTDFGIYKEPCYNVTFLDRDGTVLSVRRVCKYNYATFDYVNETEGYEFNGWSESAENVSADITLLPVFVKKQVSVKVLLEGSKNGTIINEQTDFGEWVTLTAPEYYDALFCGWYKEDELISEESEYYAEVKEDLILTARYIKAYNLICVNVATGAVNTQKIGVGNNVTVVAQEVANHVFKSFGFGTEIDYSSDAEKPAVITFLMPDKEITVYAEYERSDIENKVSVPKDKRGEITFYIFITAYVVCVAVLVVSFVVRRKSK